MKDDAQRLFVAIALPEPVRAELAALGGKRPLCYCVPSENLHLTLRFIGSCEPADRARLVKALGTVLAAPFTLHLRGAGSFEPSPVSVVVWIGVEAPAELGTLQGKIESALCDAGVAPEARPYLPHVTVAKARQVRQAWADEFLQRHAEFQSLPVAVESFGLYETIYRSNGIRYRLLESFPLE